MWARNEVAMSGRIIKDPIVFKSKRTKKPYLSFTINNRVNFTPVAVRRQIVNVRGYGYYTDYVKWLKVGDNVDVAGYMIVTNEKLAGPAKAAHSRREYHYGVKAYIHLMHLYDYSEFNRIHSGLCENFKKPKHFFELMTMEADKRNMNPEDYDSMEKFLPDFLKKEWQKKLEE